MKKRICTALLLILLLLSLSVGAFAASEGGMPLVTDAADILTMQEYEELNALADELSARYGCEIIVITISGLDGWNVEDLNEAIFEQYEFGCGEDKSGIVLLLSMEERDYDLMAHGYGNTAFSEYAKDKLMDSVLPYLGQNDWYGGFKAYISLCGTYLESARNGAPVEEPLMTPGKAIGAIVVGLIAALIVTGIQKAKMKSAALQTQADQYMNNLELRQKDDQFIRKDVTRVRHESSSSRSGGGGGGYSHHSGKF